MDGNLPADALEYLKRKNIPDLMEYILHELMVNAPEDPVAFLIDLLRQPAVPKLVITGAPASGKGTQCEKIAERFGVVHISTGDLLRAEVKKGTKVGKEAEGYMKRGELVPDSLLTGFVQDRLAEEDVKAQGWLLDGFPRTRNQALAMQTMGILPEHVLFVNCPDEIVIERIEGRRNDPVTGRVYHMVYNPPADPAVMARLEQRADDTREAIVKRLAEFHRNCREVLQCYQSILTTVDGNRSPSEVFVDIEKAVVGK